MPLSIGVNLRVTGHCNQGGRKYMEDMFSVAYQQSSNDRELEYAFFGIFDGHGGGEAATFAKENLMDIIVKQKNFWSDNDDDVLKAIRDGYVNTHYAMWRELDKWPRTASGLPSTAGTTASIAFIRKGKIYIGHVGDSGIIMGYQEKGDPLWKSKALTKDHKPECGVEMTRIQGAGGKVVSKSGVPRVVWNRPRLGHKGPVRRSTHIDEIPFLAVARSLGDLWSYNSELNTFVVSPEPDVKVMKIDVKTHRCLIFGTDGLWNMLTPQAAVAIVQAAEKHNEKHLIASQQTGHGQGDVQMWINPSKSLVDRALDRWSSTRLRADNTSVVTLMLDPPGPTHSEILLSQKREQLARPPIHAVPNTPEPVLPSESIEDPYPDTPKCSPERVSYSCPQSPSAATSFAPLSYTDIQKYPDSSNRCVDEPLNDKSNELDSSPQPEKAASNTIDTPQQDESIQVAEISSSNVTDDHNVSDNHNRSIVDPDVPAVESSLCEGVTTKEDSEIDVSLTRADTKFLLESKSWLHEVPEAEKFQQDEDSFCPDHQTIKFSEPRLRRGIHDASSSNSTNLTRHDSSGCVVLRQSGTRRHSTGASNTSQRQRLPQRRSLTPKSSAEASVTFLASGGNKLKRGAKMMVGGSECEEPKVTTKNSIECNYDSRRDSSCGEPCLKRRTRSEDVRIMQDENNPKVNDQHNMRHRWPRTDTDISKNSGVLNTSTGVIHERRLSSPNSFKRRNMEKKVTPVKAIRRTSINRPTKRLQMRDSFWDQGRTSRTGASCSSNRRQSVVDLISSITESMSSASSSSELKRWLRSDTIAATPIKTLRSRNVDIAGHTVPAQVAHQYGTVKPTRLLETPNKSKSQSNPTSSIQTTSDITHTPALPRVKTASCASTPNLRTKQSCSETPISSNTGVSINSSSTSSASIAKRAKTPYNPSARSISTRSRIKRLSK